MQPLVSILIPSYNAEPWLADTLRSAVGQTWPRVEVIVVDDGSRDGTYEVARTFDATKLKVIRQENRGASAARNRALREAQGDYLQFLDADDLLSPDKVERQVRHLQEGARDLVAACSWARFYKVPQDALFSSDLPGKVIAPLSWLLDTWDANGMMHPGAWLTPRWVAERAGPWDESLTPGVNDDGEYFCRVVLASSGITFTPGAKSYYRSGSLSSLSNPRSVAAWESLYKSLVLSTEHVLKLDRQPRTIRICAKVYQRFIYQAYPQVPHLVALAEEQVQNLGGSSLPPTGGPLFAVSRALFGWKRAKRLQSWAYERGYRRLAFGWRLHRLGERIKRLVQRGT